MSTQVQIRGATTATQVARTHLGRELDIDTTHSRLNVHNGSTAGGIPHLTFRDAINQVFTASSVTGTNAIVLDLPRAPSAYTTRMKVGFLASNTNTGATTINVNSLGAKNLRKLESASLVPLIGGEIVAGMYYEIVYDGTNFVITNHPDTTQIAPVAGGDFVISELVNNNGLEVVNLATYPTFRSVASSHLNGVQEVACKILIGGSIRLTLEHRRISVFSSDHWVRIRKNNTTINEWSRNSTSYITRTEDFSVEANDVVYVQQRTSATNVTGIMRNVRILSDTNSPAISV